MTSRKIKKSISKETMFNKIMPSYAVDDTIRHATLKKADTSDTVYTTPENQPTPQTLNDILFQNQHQVKNNVNTNVFSDKQTSSEIDKEFSKDISSSFDNDNISEFSDTTSVNYTVTKTDEPNYINIVKQSLYSKLDSMIKMFKCCDCELCRQSITLEVLNNVKPEYKYIKPSEIQHIIDENNYPDINQPIIHAIFEVKANPPHKVI